MAGLGLEETELRLGLPGGGGNDAGEAARSSGKRGFAETIDLKLKLQPSSAAEPAASGDEGDQGEHEEDADAAAPLLPSAADGKMKRSPSQSSVVTARPDPEKPRAPKAQVVGWPPVRSFRKNVLAEKAGNGDKAAAAALVKVSMDGAPYLRKVDLAMYKSYHELSMALHNMFTSFAIIGKCGSHQQLNESKQLKDVRDGAEFVPTYEDKDGDWMLVGDVPWEMFVQSCKRLRIMKGSEAIGLGQYTKGNGEMQEHKLIKES
ncbi:hypothetical protein E2562_029132 [Oryza meyeriana var. granulata]|uniref:Auxin-responsive protein n=1 Tax=Oryza meyeriana var. granulata TaxID=110450 RepID=A0A6G1EE71_9ORYZ|nr:hypothetical protein E2562_029132 [Oryza meyeriana var. granulata]